MTHPGSGNPTWQDYPNTSTPVTAAALEAMEGVLDRSVGPVCESRLTADFTANSFDGNTYYAMRSQMAPPSGMDPFGMWSQPTPGGLYVMTVPQGWGGRYNFEWTVYSVGVANKLLVIGLLNCPPATVNASVYSYAALRNGGFGDPATVSESIVLAEGDWISLAIYAVQNGSVKWAPMATVSGSVLGRSKTVLRYIGPA